MIFYYFSKPVFYLNSLTYVHITPSFSVNIQLTRSIIWLCHGSGSLSSASYRGGPRTAPELFHVWLAVDKVALGQAFLRVLRFFPVNIIPRWLSKLMYHLGDEQ
jgi:hypothetical protein